MFSDEYRGFWAETLAECEPEITSAMVIEPTRIRYYEGWGDLIAIAPDDTPEALAERVNNNNRRKR